MPPITQITRLPGFSTNPHKGLELRRGPDLDPVAGALYLFRVSEVEGVEPGLMGGLLARVSGFRPRI